MNDAFLKLCPASFKSLQQEAFLTNSLLLSGFENLIKGHNDDTLKGYYYLSFFQLSIGIERLMKLVAVCDYMLKNNFSFIPENQLRTLGHDLLHLFKKCEEVSLEYPSFINSFKPKTNIESELLVFLNSFAHSSGRYYNFSNGQSKNNQDPIDHWQELNNKIVQEDFSKKIHQKTERTIIKNLVPTFQIQDHTFNTGYVDSVVKFYTSKQANHFAVWHLITLMSPLIRLLNFFSSECHAIEIKNGINYPSIPYFNEIFSFTYVSKATALKRNRWTNF